MKIKSIVLGLLAVSMGLTACGPKAEETISLTGAGASFPAPLYQTWVTEYNKLNPGIRISYQSVGSGAGVEQFIQETVDFGASDVAMKDEAIAKVDRGVKLLPMTAGAIVMAYNLPGVDDLKLSREIYVDILLGEIGKWNDARIVKLNPSINLPDLDITVIVRSDGSGTTGVFTKHLSAISKEFKTKVGEGKTVEWPAAIGAKGNEGITAQILQTKGAIGYIEYGYAKQNDIAMAILENKEGNYVAPTFEAASETLSQVVLPENLRAFITDPGGSDSYPIVSYTWLLVYEEGYEEKDEAALEAFINWALTEGQTYSPRLGYIPLPDNVVEKVQLKLEE